MRRKRNRLQAKITVICEGESGTAWGVGRGETKKMMMKEVKSFMLPFLSLVRVVMVVVVCWW